MDILFHPPTNRVLAALFLALAVGSAWRGARLFFRGLGTADHPSAPVWIIGGLRGAVVAVAMSAFAGGVLFAQSWVLIFGAVFLAEELYETQVLSLAARTVVRSSPDRH